jgi:uncharacterized Ntn-hydrolase superfamily protein
MTVSICVRERYEADGTEHVRFGVAVTTRIPGVGAMCPFASADGAIATQGVANVDLGRRGIEYLEDGLAVEDALRSLLNADPESETRQVHGVDADGTFAFSGDACGDWYGHREGPGYTVAGNLLTGEAVLDVVAETYEASAPDSPEETVDPLAGRLVDALAAGHRAGGDRRDDLPIQSAAVLVDRTQDRDPSPYYEDLRVDASETPLSDLRETYERARRGYRQVLEKYGVDDPDTAETDAEVPSRETAVGDSRRGTDGARGSQTAPAGLDAFVEATGPEELVETMQPSDLLPEDGPDESPDGGETPGTAERSTDDDGPGAAETSTDATGGDEQSTDDDG